jgi:hypothetical protein
LLFEVRSDDSNLFNWGQMNVLALFQTEPQFRLLDAKDVQADRFAGFWKELPRLPIDRDTDAVIIGNNHHNSSQDYLGLTLVSAERDKLKTIFELPTLLQTNSCGQTFSQTLTLTPLKKSTGARRHPLQVKIKLVKEPDDGNCEKKTGGYTRYFQDLLVWNPAKSAYVSRGKGLSALEKFNEKLF